jgi:membrane-associated protein
LDHHALNATRGFFDRHGGKALVLARFVPVVRTFAPFVAGIAGMPWRRFQFYNVLGAGVWVGGLVCAGIVFGNIPIVRQYLNVIILVGIAVAVVPTIVGVLWKLLRKN